jgi:YesN/AraC family two-component response regulator
MNNLKKLQMVAKGIGVLYVEDNDSLRENAGKLIHKFFSKVDLAQDGAVALAKFKKYHYPIVITDIKMPHMDGIRLAKSILHIKPDTKVIIMSAFDEKEFLYKSIEIGIFRFLKKPVNLTELSDILYAATTQIRHELNTKLFYTNLQNIFNYQSSMVVMLNEMKPILANQIFLDFFDVESIEDFREKCLDIGRYFMEHNGFLYIQDGVNWFETVCANEKKLFHVKMKNIDNSIRHLILKYQLIPEKTGYGILSFDDVTELNLLKLFDEKQTKNDLQTQDKKAMFDLLKVVHRNSAKIEIHNYYKGLSITNDAIIAEIKDDSIVIKTSFLQQKAIQYEKKTFLLCEAFPHALECLEVVKIGFEKQLVELKSLKFITTSPIMRSTIRVVPDEKQSVSLFIRENKFIAETYIEDISLKSIRLHLSLYPAGLEEGDSVILDIVLELDKKPLILNTKATMLRKIESKKGCSIVFLFDGDKKELLKYITKRQMAIIREFKGMQNG